MCRSSCRAAARFICAAFVVILAPLRLPAGTPAPPADAAQAHELYLAVVINGKRTGQIAAFRRRPDGRLTAERGELEEIGLKAGRDSGASVDLAALDGLDYRVDEVTQTIFITAGDPRLRPAVYDAGAPRSAGGDMTPETAFGGVLNYTVFATTNAEFGNWFRFDDHAPVVSGAVEGRVFGRYGVLSQSATANSDIAGVDNAVRLDTTWSYSDPETLRTWRAGDFISGGLTWTRPVRLGGVQVQRNFELQPDLITQPVPEFSASAAVPSTVEVFANNVQVFEKDVPAGPFVVSNIPVVSGAGTARVVVNDSLGRETVAELPFYTTPAQLREGLYDFSLEAGVPRRSYGVRSNDYAGGLAGTATARYGVSDALTLEGHAEAGADVLNAGAGAVFPLAHYGVASIAAAASRNGDGDTGALLAASFETEFRGISFHARTKRAMGDYADLASASTRRTDPAAGTAFYRARPARSVDQAVLGFPVGFDPARVALNYTRIEDGRGGTLRTAGASLIRPVGRSASFYATGFTQLGEDNHGLFAGLTFRLGDRTSGTLSASSGPGGTVGGIEVSRSERARPGSYGWRLRAREGDRPDRLISASYRTGSARLRGTLQQYGDAVRATAEIDGGVAVAGGSVFLTPRIHDAFALVDAGEPDLAVYRENRPAGTTDGNGQLIVPDLNAYEANTVSIDPENLPLDARIGHTKRTVMPADRSGVRVDFGIDTQTRTARALFRDTRGQPLPAGSRGRLAGTEETFVIGYDGLAYLRDVKSRNTARVTLDTGGTCRAEFAAPGHAGAAAEPMEVTCR